MMADQNRVRDLVEEIVRQVRDSGAAAGDPSSTAASPFAGVFDDVYAAIYAADNAFKQLSATSLDTRRDMIAAMEAGNGEPLPDELVQDIWEDAAESRLQVIGPTVEVVCDGKTYRGPTPTKGDRELIVANRAGETIRFVHTASLEAPVMAKRR